MLNYIFGAYSSELPYNIQYFCNIYEIFNTKLLTSLIIYLYTYCYPTVRDLFLNYFSLTRFSFANTGHTASSCKEREASKEALLHILKPIQKSHATQLA